MSDRHPHTLRHRPRLRPRGDRGLTLLECTLALLLVGIVVVFVLQIDTNTINTSIDVKNRQLAMILAEQVMALESMGEMPTAVGDNIIVGPTEVDPSDERFCDVERGDFPYNRFTYHVEKELEEISTNTNLAQKPEDRDPNAEIPVEGEEPAKTVQVVRIKVTVTFPDVRYGGSLDSGGAGASATDGAVGHIVLETYVIDQMARAQQAQNGGNTGETTGGGTGR